MDKIMKSKRDLVRKGKNLQKIEYLENEKSFLDEIKSIFHNFWNPFIR